ncbi:MAG TPA: PQQ-dependent sugar dehydrogenase [Burkholderiaceae bacterium]|nr:PQQ-dependent sugar dehydrogenase [Burkholderiaceae bacterium]
MRALVLLAAAVATVAFGAARSAAAPAQPVASERTSHGEVRVVEIARGLEHPWGLAFLPDGRILVTERPGRLRIIDRGGAVSEPLSGVPAVHARGQGGLLDVAIGPDFARDRSVFLSYAEPADGNARTAVARAVLDGQSLRDLRVIFRQQPATRGNNHFGSRLVFARDGTLFVTLGDRFGYREQAQSLRDHIGTVVRIRADGAVPDDNPFAGRGDALPQIWSYGHRNVQGAALHPQTGKLWTHEHGARGGDEVNVTEAGRNYGWPVITHGVDYSGATIGEGTHKAGMEQPLVHWTPSIAPSGMAFYTGDRWPQWRGSLFVGALAARMLVRLELDGERVVREERLLTGLRERIRDVRQGPDGSIYLLTDSRDGRVLRVEPAD